MKLVQAGLFVRGLLRSHTKSCPLSPSPPSPPSPPTSLTSFSSGFRDSHQVPIEALDRACSPGSSTIVRAPLLRYLRGNLSWICCGDIFWSVPALSGTVSPLSGVWAGIGAGAARSTTRTTGGAGRTGPGRHQALDPAPTHRAAASSIRLDCAPARSSIWC